MHACFNAYQCIRPVHCQEAASQVPARNCPEQVTLPHIHFPDDEINALQDPETVQEVQAMRAAHVACFQVQPSSLSCTQHIACQPVKMINPTVMVHTAAVLSCTACCVIAVISVLFC